MSARPDDRRSDEGEREHHCQITVLKLALLHYVSFQERGTSLSVVERASGLTM